MCKSKLFSPFTINCSKTCRDILNFRNTGKLKILHFTTSLVNRQTFQTITALGTWTGMSVFVLVDTLHLWDSKTIKLWTKPGQYGTNDFLKNKNVNFNFKTKYTLPVRHISFYLTPFTQQNVCNFPKSVNVQVVAILLYLLP